MRAVDSVGGTGSEALPRLRRNLEIATEVAELCVSSSKGFGATYNIFVGSMVGAPFIALTIIDGVRKDVADVYNKESLIDDLKEFLHTHKVFLRQPKCCIGVWEGTSEDGPFRQIEVSFLFERSPVGTELVQIFGLKWNQISAYDLFIQEEIDTYGTGVSDIPRMTKPQRFAEFLRRQAAVCSAEEQRHRAEAPAQGK